MPKQPAFSGLRDLMKKKVSRREQFLAEMDAVVPWGRLLTLIERHYPKTGPKGGRPPMPLERMLRVYFSGTVHSLDTTTAKVHDTQVWDELLHGEETSVWADRGYVSAEREAAFKAPKGGPLQPVDAQINRIIASVRAKVEHPFRVLKRQFRYVTTRYRGLAENCAQLFTLFTLGNLLLARRRLMA